MAESVLVKDMNEELKAEDLEFIIFCIENMAIRHKKSGEEMYRILAEDSHVLDQYIIPCADVLHTFDMDYMLDDVENAMKSMGVSI